MGAMIQRQVLESLQQVRPVTADHAGELRVEIARQVQLMVPTTANVVAGAGLEDPQAQIRRAVQEELAAVRAEASSQRSPPRRVPRVTNLLLPEAIMPSHLLPAEAIMIGSDGEEVSVLTGGDDVVDVSD